MEGLPASLGGSTQPSMSLSDILQQSRKLTNQLGRDSDLPPIQLGIDQIESQSRKLVSKSVRGGNPAADARAHYLLASGGIDATQLSNAIQQSNIANTFEPLQPVYDTDMDGFIRHEHEQVILSMIEEGRRSAQEDFQQDLSRSLHRDWQTRKQRILEELGQHRTLDNSSQASFRRSVTAAPPKEAMSDTSIAQHSRMIRYDTVMSRLNRARLDGESMPLIHAFMETVESFAQEPSRKHALLDAWVSLKYMVHETQAKGAAAPVHAREYAPVYMDVHTFQSSPAGTALREKWIRGARSFLETQFCEYVEQTIASNPLKAQRGGVPSARATAAAFLRVQLRNAEGAWPPTLSRPLDAATQSPLWALVFHLVRMGHSKDALACVQENEDAIQATDASFLAFFKAWVDDPMRQLPRSMRDHWMGEYVTRFRNVVPDDPYRYALYRIMGRFDVTKKFPTPLVLSTENWLWLQLCLISETPVGDSHAPALQSYTLQDLANKLEKYGEAHFDPKGHRPLHYFQLLLLVGRFENAVAFLCSRPAYQVDAVHFAIALTYYGLLRVSSAAQAPSLDLISVSNHVSYIDLAKLLRRYISSFAQTSRRDALAYMSVLCLNADCPSPVGPEQVERCHEQVQALLLDTPTSALVDLLGDIRSDNLMTRGLIEQAGPLLHLADRSLLLSKIVHVAAEQCVQEQRMTDAILLFNYAQERDTVMSVLNRELGALLMEPADLSDWTAPLQEGTLPLTSSTHIVLLARAVLANYEQQGHTSGQMDVCRTLLGLKQAASLYRSEQLTSALQVLESLHVLPLDTESRKDVVSITRKAESFKLYDDSITMNFSDIVLMAMNLLYKLHQSLKESMERTNSVVLFEYQSQARALMMWAGMLRFRMSNETYCQLTRLDVFVR